MVGTRNQEWLANDHSKLKIQKQSCKMSDPKIINDSAEPKADTGMLRDDALKGKTVIVTGGGTGLGKAMGTYFLKLGANLIITSRKLDILKQTAAEMESETGGKGISNCLRRKKNTMKLKKCFRRLLKAFGRIDGLVNNAAWVILFRLQNACSCKCILNNYRYCVKRFS